jgi:hypothetical protein
LKNSKSFIKTFKSPYAIGKTGAASESTPTPIPDEIRATSMPGYIHE